MTYVRVEFAPGLPHGLGSEIVAVEAYPSSAIYKLFFKFDSPKMVINLRWDAGKNLILDAFPRSMDNELTYDNHSRIQEAIENAYRMQDSVPVAKPGYHLNKIIKGVLGETSKIREELEELDDAMAQGVKIMAAVEVADLIGAIEAFINKEFPGLTWEDFDKMKVVTQRAFKNGART